MGYFEAKYQHKGPKSAYDMPRIPYSLSKRFSDNMMEEESTDRICAAEGKILFLQDNFGWPEKWTRKKASFEMSRESYTRLKFFCPVGASI